MAAAFQKVHCDSAFWSGLGRLRTSGVTAGHSTSSMFSSSTKCCRQNCVMFCLTAQPGGPKS